MDVHESLELSRVVLDELAKVQKRLELDTRVLNDLRCIDECVPKNVSVEVEPEIDLSPGVSCCSVPIFELGPRGGTEEVGDEVGRALVSGRLKGSWMIYRR